MVFSVTKFLQTHTQRVAWGHRIIVEAGYQIKMSRVVCFHGVLTLSMEDYTQKYIFNIFKIIIIIVIIFVFSCNILI